MLWRAADPRVDAATYVGGLAQAVVDGEPVFASGGFHQLPGGETITAGHVDIMGDPWNPPTIDVGTGDRAYNLDNGIGGQISNCRLVSLGTRGERSLFNLSTIGAGETCPFIRSHNNTFDNVGLLRYSRAGADDGSELSELIVSRTTLRHCVQPLYVFAKSVPYVLVEHVTVEDSGINGIILSPSDEDSQLKWQRFLLHDVTIRGNQAEDVVNDAFNNSLRVGGQNVEVYNVLIEDHKPIRFDAGTGFYEQFVGNEGLYSKSVNFRADNITLIDGGGDEASMICKGGAPPNPGPNGARSIVTNVHIEQTVAAWPGMGSNILTLDGLVMDSWGWEAHNIRTVGLAGRGFVVYPNGTYDALNGDAATTNVITNFHDIHPRRDGSSVPMMVLRGHGGLAPSGNTIYYVVNSRRTPSAPSDIDINQIESGTMTLNEIETSW